MTNDIDKTYNRPVGMQENVISQILPTSNKMSSAGEEEIVAEVDEPPDKQLSPSAGTPMPNLLERNRGSDYFKSTPPRFDRRESLLTRALITDSELSPHDDQPEPIRPTRPMSTSSNQSNVSTISTVELTSDGGITSPDRTDTPSPPLPQTAFAGLDLLGPKVTFNDQTAIGNDGKEQTLPSANLRASQEKAVEAGLGRKRCISFACGRNTQPTPAAIETSSATADSHASVISPTPAAPPKRACMLKFVCPTRASKQQESNTKDAHTSRLRSPPPANEKLLFPLPERQSRLHRDSDSTIREVSPKSVPQSPSAVRSRKPQSLNHADLRHSEATRFHEFASSVEEVDEWIHESTVHRHKMTIGDTLKKENAIRRLGEEAEEEALQDEEDEDDDDDENEEDAMDDDDDDEDNHSDLGNETDNEAGFADSDDDSDTRSDYQFWTPGGTTAATSNDHIEHIRPTVPRVASDSSLESTTRKDQLNPIERSTPSKSRRATRRPKVRPGTPDLPDSTDFVCGTLDEDRPLEQAYVSCLMERKRSKHTLVPQDIDPSFPTSDLEDDDEDDDAHHSEDNLWIKGQLDDLEDGALQGRGRHHVSPHRKSPLHSPRRLRSPAAVRRGTVHRSPPPRRLLGHSPRRVRSPPPARGYKSPPPSRRTSLAGSPDNCVQGIDFTPLSRRPNLTHTKSLPRHSNRFTQCFEAHLSGLDEDESVENFSDKSNRFHDRGAIDIVKGLENKRQRRREKQLHKQCRNNGKEKWRKPQPGKGAERMRELGLEMAGKGRRLHGQAKAQYMLSI